MKSDNAVLGWLSLNGVLQAIKSMFGVIEPYLNSILTASQILVALATFVLVIYKVLAARKAAKSE
jgi:hypothetical protein